MDDFYIDEPMNACIIESVKVSDMPLTYSVRFREKQMENAERDRMLANDPDHEEGEMYSGSDGDYDGRRGVEYRGRRGSGKEFVDARELIRESRRARSRSADAFGKTFCAFIRFDLSVEHYEYTSMDGSCLHLI